MVLLLSGFYFSPQYVLQRFGFLDWRNKNSCPPQHLGSVVKHVYLLTRLATNGWNTAKHEFEGLLRINSCSTLGSRLVWSILSTTPPSEGGRTKSKTCVGPKTVSTCQYSPALNVGISAFSGICRTDTVPQKCQEASEATPAAELLEEECKRTYATIYLCTYPINYVYESYILNVRLLTIFPLMLTFIVPHRSFRQFTAQG